MKRRGTIRTIPLFSSCSDTEIDQLLAKARPIYYRKGSLVFNEGDPGNFLLVIRSGQVKITLPKEGGEELFLFKLGEGHFFGELTLLDETPRAATVTTTAPTEFLKIDGDDFRTLIESNKEFQRKILAHLSRRIREANHRARILSIFDSYEKILRCLLQLAHDSSRTEETSIEIENPPSQHELANMVGCTRETVNRTLKVLEINGYIERSTKKIKLNTSMLKHYWFPT